MCAAGRPRTPVPAYRIHRAISATHTERMNTTKKQVMKTTSKHMDGTSVRPLDAASETFRRLQRVAKGMRREDANRTAVVIALHALARQMHLPISIGLR